MKNCTSPHLYTNCGSTEKSVKSTKWSRSCVQRSCIFLAYKSGGVTTTISLNLGENGKDDELLHRCAGNSKGRRNRFWQENTGVGIPTSCVYNTIYIRFRILILVHNILATIKIAVSEFGREFKRFGMYFLQISSRRRHLGGSQGENWIASPV